MIMRLPIAIAIAGVMLTVPLPRMGTAQVSETVGASETFKLSGRIVMASGNHDVYVSLWQAEGFLNKSVRQILIKRGETCAFAFNVPAGRWAVSAFEDTNGNGTLDMGAFGPKEPSGFWRAFNGRRKPRFEDVCSPIEGDTSGADVTLR